MNEQIKLNHVLILLNEQDVNQITRRKGAPHMNKAPIRSQKRKNEAINTCVCQFISKSLSKITL
jgi:hypothetical protein